MNTHYRIILQHVNVWIGAVGLVVTTPLGAPPARGDAPAHIVIMKSISYETKLIEIQPGDKVIWSNQSYTNHSATADDGSTFDTGMVAPKGRSKEITFSQAGTFQYHCSLHGKTMSGEIKVGPKRAANANATNLNLKGQSQ